ncbi:MAG: glycosyltransferase family 2 protein [Pseudobutyrivibrio sp.]|nr:glycosyltransferase family 2 protein [Pseudobutyrivibrio sp.]
MVEIAIILTVFNRRNVTLCGLRSLYQAIENLSGDYNFDIYMTDDGCTDGTAEAVAKDFPEVHIIQGDGNLFWSGGMRKAWQAAISSGIEYNYFLWFNDDADLYNDALITMFSSMNMAGDDSIISGAFRDHNNIISYGGRDRKEQFVVPNGELSPIFLINGNFILIPQKIFKQIGMIDDIYRHGFGDWDYGLRAIEANFSLYLSTNYDGITDRHDADLVDYANSHYSLSKRWKSLYNKKNNPRILFIFKFRHFGLFSALLSYIAIHIYTILPCIYKFRLKVIPS